MVTIISGTNRKDNVTRQVALEYRRFLDVKEIENNILLMDDEDMTSRNNAFIKIENDILIPAQKFIIISPEYNGSYPGILKLMIDNSDVARCWWHKKVLLTGVSTGRA